MCCKYGVQVGCQYVCTGKQLSLDQTKRNLTCRDLEISLVVIRLVVTELKKTGFVYLLDLFRGRVGIEGVV